MCYQFINVNCSTKVYNGQVQNILISGPCDVNGDDLVIR